ncbi:organic cation transporter-like protein isoform X2 [Daphnia pulex]|uniref:organic cation transporter-like protein isoform X2 n=1 Tax=Daphnia pulex TaxID=6669 RepID=UPI001EDFCD6E|nr:organic cation transporter-like protein isoform X2 [Daphnia pulex]
MTELWAGEFGRYQWIQYLLHLLPAFTGGVHMLSQVEVGATPRHRCLAVNDTILEYVGSCHYVSVRNETLPCKAWEYDRTYYESTIVTDWDLVCDRRWMASVSQSAYMLGALIASSLLGQLSDRYGRWKVLVPTGALQMVFATGCGFVQNYYLYVALRFLIAVNVSGAYMIGFVLSKKFDGNGARPIPDHDWLQLPVGVCARDHSCCWMGIFSPPLAHFANHLWATQFADASSLVAPTMDGSRRKVVAELEKRKSPPKKNHYAA